MADMLADLPSALALTSQVDATPPNNRINRRAASGFHKVP